MRKLLKISCLLHAFLSESDTVTYSCTDKTSVTVGEKTYCAYIPGLYCKTEHYHSPGNKCKKCPDGSICDAERRANFELIPGGYSDEQQKTVPKVKNPGSETFLRYVNKELTLVESGYSPLGSNEVTPCPDGTYAPIAGLEYPWQCYTCPPGYFCSNGIKTLCDEYTPISPFGAKFKAECEVCEPGYICKNGTLPDVCDLGYYYDASLEECVGCKKGTKCGFAASEETICKFNTYNPFEKQAICIECEYGEAQSCPDGATAIQRQETCIDNGELPSDIEAYDLNFGKCQKKCLGKISKYPVAMG